MADDIALPQRSGSTPNPDPTVLTTEQLLRSLLAERALTDIQFAAIKQLLDLLRGEISGQTGHQRELNDEKFRSLAEQVRTQGAGVQLQFDERDIRSKAAELAAQVAVGAALQAQKEAAGAQNESNSAAITKSEAATAKQIDGIQALINSIAVSFNDKIAGIISRLDRSEMATLTQQTVRTDRRADTGSMIAIIGLGATLVMVVLGILGFEAIHQSPPLAPVVATAPLNTLRAP
jgi:hypothetical protein